ncbi:MAG: orotidine-5'-phosphate decarboxylase [Janthinobacterium lividum]
MSETAITALSEMAKADLSETAKAALSETAKADLSKQSLASSKLKSRMDAGNSLLCVGLDPELSKLPARFKTTSHPLFEFCRFVIDATAEFACAFKPNTAFFEAHGSRGWDELAMVFAHLRAHHPQHFTVCDAKRADIGSTNRGYVQAVFDELGADAITLHPYLGREALAPFLEREDKASIILCRTSNAGAGELQDLMSDGKPFWQHVAERVDTQWNTKGNCMLVVGATYPQEMQRIREAAPEMTFLVPGIGAQGGDIEATVRAGLRADGQGLILSSSRAILYSNDPAAAARDTRDAINAVRETLHATR